MIDESPNQVLPGHDELNLLPLPPVTFIERHGISPTLFAFLVLIIIFVLYQIVGGLATAFLLGFKPTAENVKGFRIATGAGEILLILIPTLFLTRFASRVPKDYLRLRAPDVRTLLVPLVGIFSLQQLLQIYLYLQDRIPLPPSVEQTVRQFKDILEEAYRLLVSTHSIPELIFVTVVVALIPAFAEELMFRGLIQRSLEKGSTPMRGAILTGIIFGAYHLNPFSIVPLVVLGIYLGFLTMRANSIWVSITAHFYNNAIACIFVYLMRDEGLITGDPGQMPASFLLLTFIGCSILFALSTYYFIVITRKVIPVDQTREVSA
jgi:membrane protease YdiL (CAAX protease family)